VDNSSKAVAGSTSGLPSSVRGGAHPTRRSERLSFPDACLPDAPSARAGGAGSHLNLKHIPALDASWYAIADSALTLTADEEMGCSRRAPTWRTGFAMGCGAAEQPAQRLEQVSIKSRGQFPMPDLSWSSVRRCRRRPVSRSPWSEQRGSGSPAKHCRRKPDPRSPS
jgi:hypothetical protein